MAEEKSVIASVQCLTQDLLNRLEISNGTITASPFGDIGNNYMGIMTKVQVKGLNKQKQFVNLNLIAKSAPRMNAYRHIFPVHESYKREIYIYSQLFPELERLQEEKNILKPFNSYPKYYASVIDDINEALILEDMSHLDYRMANPVEPLDLDHLLLVIREYGKFHAISFALRDQKPEVFDELYKNTQDTFYSNLNADFYEDSIKMICSSVISCLDPVSHKMEYDKFKAYQGKMKNLLHEVLNPDAAGKYAVITHGDCWINNLLFKYEDRDQPKYPTKVCVLDWQMARLGSPVMDISYFIFTCSDKAVRDKYYDHLIKEYYYSLSSMLRKLGCDPERVFPYQVLQDHLKRFSSFGLHRSLVTIFLIFGNTDKSKEKFNTEDGRDLQESFHYEINDITYDERIRNVILDFFKYGYDW